MTSLPQITYGTITDTDATNPSGAKVILRNDRTGEKISDTTSSTGKYLLDAANLTSGYMSTDRLTVICAYGDEKKEESYLISDSMPAEELNLTLVALAESTDTTYCEIQDVLDELGDKDTDDIGYERIRKIILRAEEEIEDRTESKFSSTTATDEIYDLNKYTSYVSPDNILGGRTSNVRQDSMRGGYYNDRIQLRNRPIISITSLYKNSAGVASADSWGTALTEQEGDGGDFVKNTRTGTITFVDNLPATQARSVKVTYTYGYSTVPKTVEKLCILLSVRDVIISKRTESQFDGNRDINLGDISMSKFDSPSYFNWLNEEIERLWNIVGDLHQTV